MKKVSATRIYSGDGRIWEDQVIVLDNEGTILSIDPANRHDPSSVKHYPGVITPGFINAHCHLELSHMKGVIPTGTGLLPFLKSVVTLRDFDPEFIEDSIRKADQEMMGAGIVAVGDISNKADTAAVKAESQLVYHTFIEVFDFLQNGMASELFKKSLEVWKQQSDHGMNKKTLVPHAPYSVSPSLFGLINDFNEAGQSISIHNQETWHENELFQTGGGGFGPLWESFGFDMGHFQPSGKSSLAHIRPMLRKDQRILLVHNTQTTRQDIIETIEWNKHAYWVSCPNANLYIENQLPRYDIFQDQNAKVCLGTDSLSSNWQLSILEEMKTVQRFQSRVSFDELIIWACYNGACALGYEDELGVLKQGSKPGILHIDLDPAELILKASHQVERIA